MAYGTSYADPTGPSRRSRLGLTHRALAQAALDLLTEEGLASLTMQRLAERLGVGTMTLYGYFRDKDALLDGVIELAGSRVEIPAAEGPWRERLRALMLAFHGHLRAYPFLVELRLRRPLTTPQALRWTEAALAILDEAGLDTAEAARAYRLLFVYAFGDAAFAPGVGNASAATRGYTPLLPPEAPELPHVLAAGKELAAAFTSDESFAAGLEQLLDGIEAQAKRASARSQG
jgi:AcrR family transcriptional regulator